MRTTLELSEDDVARARQLSGISRISDLVREGLKALIAREARKRLVLYGGTDPEAQAPGRDRGLEVAEPHGPR